MDFKHLKSHFYWSNRLMLLQIVCVLISFLPFIVTIESNPTINHGDRIAEAKANLLKMIQKRK